MNKCGRCKSYQRTDSDRGICTGPAQMISECEFKTFIVYSHGLACEDFAGYMTTLSEINGVAKDETIESVDVIAARFRESVEKEKICKDCDAFTKFDVIWGECFYDGKMTTVNNNCDDWHEISTAKTGKGSAPKSGTDTLPDSGTHRVFSTGSVRDGAKGKGRPSLTSSIATLRTGVHMERGAENYGSRNWELGQPVSEFLESAYRHYLKFLLGCDKEDHLAAIRFNIDGIMQMEQYHPELCDLESRKGKRSFNYFKEEAK